MRSSNSKILAGTVVLLIASRAHAQNSEPAVYLNPALPAEQRAADLVHRMTVEEKVTQLTNQSRAIDRLHIPAYNSMTYRVQPNPGAANLDSSGSVRAKKTCSSRCCTQ